MTLYVKPRILALKRRFRLRRVSTVAVVIALIFVLPVIARIISVFAVLPVVITVAAGAVIIRISPSTATRVIIVIARALVPARTLIIVLIAWLRAPVISRVHILKSNVSPIILSPVRILCVRVARRSAPSPGRVLAMILSRRAARLAGVRREGILRILIVICNYFALISTAIERFVPANFTVIAKSCSGTILTFIGRKVSLYRSFCG